MSLKVRVSKEEFVKCLEPLGIETADGLAEMYHKSLENKAFYIWDDKKQDKPRKECVKDCPLYKCTHMTVHCGYYYGGWCNHHEYGEDYDELVVLLEDAQKIVEEVREFVGDYIREYYRVRAEKIRLEKRLDRIRQIVDFLETRMKIIFDDKCEKTKLGLALATLHHIHLCLEAVDQK